MKTFISRFKIAVTGFLLIFTVGTTAARIVFDPSNFSQNVVTAAKSVMTEINSATTAINQIQQTAIQLRNIASLDGLARTVGLENELRTYREIRAIDQQMTGILNDTKNLYDNLGAQFGASNFSWRQFMDGRVRMEASRAEGLLSKVNTLNRQLEDVSNQRAEVVSRLESADGQKQATQAVGAAVNVVIGQNQQVISALNTIIADKDADRQRTVKEEEASQKINEDYQAKLRENALRARCPNGSCFQPSN